jgi:hypothetical protein
MKMLLDYFKATFIEPAKDPLHWIITILIAALFILLESRM